MPKSFGAHTCLCCLCCLCCLSCPALASSLDLVRSSTQESRPAAVSASLGASVREVVPRDPFSKESAASIVDLVERVGASSRPSADRRCCAGARARASISSGGGPSVACDVWWSHGVVGRARAYWHELDESSAVGDPPKREPGRRWSLSGGRARKHASVPCRSILPGRVHVAARCSRCQGLPVSSRLRLIALCLPAACPTRAMNRRAAESAGAAHLHGRVVSERAAAGGARRCSVVAA